MGRVRDCSVLGALAQSSTPFHTEPFIHLALCSPRLERPHPASGGAATSKAPRFPRAPAWLGPPCSPRDEPERCSPEVPTGPCPCSGGSSCRDREAAEAALETVAAPFHLKMEFSRGTASPWQSRGRLGRLMVVLVHGGGQCGVWWLPEHRVLHSLGVLPSRHRSAQPWQPGLSGGLGASGAAAGQG